MSEPTKQEISQVFKKLRALGPNKVSGVVPILNVICDGHVLTRVFIEYVEGVRFRGNTSTASWLKWF